MKPAAVPPLPFPPAPRPAPLALAPPSPLPPPRARLAGGWDPLPRPAPDIMPTLNEPHQITTRVLEPTSCQMDTDGDYIYIYIYIYVCDDVITTISITFNNKQASFHP